MKSNSSIYFFQEDIVFKLSGKTQIKQWLSKICQSENLTIVTLNYIFCNDEYLLTINKDYLNHDYYTDIITFSYSDKNELIEGDVFISIERVKENASILKTTFQEELARVMVHGLLHLMGYNDSTSQQKAIMRKKEDSCLSLR